MCGIRSRLSIERRWFREKSLQSRLGSNRPVQYRQELLPSCVIEDEQAPIRQHLTGMRQSCGDGEIGEVGAFNLGGATDECVLLRGQADRNSFCLSSHQ